jgi:general nucleoside transport system permease protein
MTGPERSTRSAGTAEPGAPAAASGATGVGTGRPDDRGVRDAEPRPQVRPRRPREPAPPDPATRSEAASAGRATRSEATSADPVTRSEAASTGRAGMTDAGAVPDRLVGRLLRNPAGAHLAVPFVALLGALVVGGVLMAVEGVAPLSAYGEVLYGAVGRTRGLVDTAIIATPLVLLALGITVAYRARVYTIGAEGQYIAGALAGTAWATVGPALPTVPLIVTSLAVAVLVGGAWAGVTGWLQARFGASVVITGLLLNYVAAAALAWAVRVGIRDPGAFTPQSRQVGAAALGDTPGTAIHLGFLFALLAVPALAVVLRRTRFGFRVEVLGANPEVLAATEARPAWTRFAVLAVAGGFAGLAGFVEVAGVTGRMTPAFATGYGFTAIIVALLGRLRPVGVLVAGLVLAGLTVGFDEAERVFVIPSATVGVIQALIIVFFVAGEAIARRPRRGRAG